MRIVEFSSEFAEPIALFESQRANSVALASGHGDVHVYCLHIGPNGFIGEHPTGLCQLLLVVQGSGWAVGADGLRVELRSGQGAFFERGELHAKGSERGMLAVMVQATSLQPPHASSQPA